MEYERSQEVGLRYSRKVPTLVNFQAKDYKVSI